MFIYEYRNMFNPVAQGADWRLMVKEGGFSSIESAQRILEACKTAAVAGFSFDEMKSIIPRDARFKSSLCTYEVGANTVDFCAKGRIPLFLIQRYGGTED